MDLNKKLQSFIPEKNPECRPTPVQAEFMRLVAEKYYYLGLGDTAHSCPELDLFGLHTDTLSALSEAGKKYFFLEQGGARQKQLDLLMEGKDSKFEYGSSHIGPEAKEKLRSAFKKAASAGIDARFICADTRIGFLKELKLGIKTISNIFSAARRGCPTGEIVKSGLGPLLDDRETSELVKSFDGPSVLYFGAGHFSRTCESADQPTSFFSLLQEDGKSMAVMNVKLHPLQEDVIEKYRSYFSDLTREPDAELYVLPSLSYPDGIKIINPALQPLYEKAVRTVTIRDIYSTPVRPTTLAYIQGHTAPPSQS